MTVLAVDLAAKYSAACLMDEDFMVRAQFDSWDKSEEEFLARLTDTFTQPHGPDLMAVEDLPHGLPYSTLVKTVCRLQGRVVHAMHMAFARRNVLFVAPATWRAHYTGMERGTGPQAVFPVSERYGYTPPDLSIRAKDNGGKSRATKVASDYCSAYLIARWAIDMKKQYGTYDVPGTSRYDTAVIRKKDFDDQDR